MNTQIKIPRTCGFSGERLDHYGGYMGLVKTYSYDRHDEVTVDKYDDGTCVLCVLGKGYFFYEASRAASAFSDARAEANHNHGINRALR
jgi:hypothetical protein